MFKSPWRTTALRAIGLLLAVNGAVAVTRNESWTQFSCEHESTVRRFDKTPSFRWHSVNTDDAWRDIVRNWKDNESKHPNADFMTSVMETLQMDPAHCSAFPSSDPTYNGCSSIRPCPKSADGPDSGPAAAFIFESLRSIHSLHWSYDEALWKLYLNDMQPTFAPASVATKPKGDTMAHLLINLLRLGTLSITAPRLNRAFKARDYFFGENDAIDVLKQSVFALLRQQTSVARDLLPDGKNGWAPTREVNLTSSMNQVFDGWSHVNALALRNLFNGSEASIDALGRAIADGQLIEGRRYKQPDDDKDGPSLRDIIDRTFYGLGIPELWRASGIHAFIIDSGLRCGDGNDNNKDWQDQAPLREHLDEAAVSKAGACIDGWQFYLVRPASKSPTREKFSMPPGLEELLAGRTWERTWGGVCVEDLVRGAVGTWLKSGRKNNAGGIADNVADSIGVDDVLDVDITTPGLIRLPVCSPERAREILGKSGKNPEANFPCD